MIRLWQVVTGVINGVLRSIFANDADAGLTIAQAGAGSLLVLKQGASSKLSVGNSGNLTLADGQTLTSAGGGGAIGIAASGANGTTFTPGTASGVPLVAKGAAAQSADLFQVQTSAGVVLAAFEKDGDLDASGGFKNSFGFMQANVAANQSAVALDILGLAGNSEIVLPYAGSVIGISIASNAARSAGTLTAEATINGTATGLQAQLDGTNPQYHYATQAKDSDGFAAGDRLGVKLTTSADWSPTTADIVMIVVVEF